MTNSGITVSDFFCGAGGSSWGFLQAGLDVVFAANHDPICIDTHAANLPHSDVCSSDLTQHDHKTFPKTDIVWLSPECQGHSSARTAKTNQNALYETDLWGERQIDPGEERSRMTMYEAFRYAAIHLPSIIIIENVPQIRKWAKFPAFLHEMKNLGYAYQGLILNSRFFGVAQNRERYYGIFWKHNHPAPDLNFCPLAPCQKHGIIPAVQTWKPGTTGHQYGLSYHYRCPHCHARVEPPSTPSSAIIDWSLPSPRVTDRKRHLASKTRTRILSGLRKFSKNPFILDKTHTTDPRHVYAVSRPLPTLTTQQSLYLSIPTPTTNPHDDNWEQLIDKCLYRLLTPTELKLAQSLPHNYILLGSNAKQTSMIGNAVSSLVAQALAERCLPTF